MNKIMISIQPQWVNKILNGEKIIEIRKTKPNCELPCRVYIYCTKNRHLALVVGGGNSSLFRCCDSETAFICGGKLGNGKVVAEFTLDSVYTLWQNNKDKTSTARVVDKESFEKASCMAWEQYCEYHKCKNGKYPNSYAWHISGLKVYDQPKEIDEFYKRCHLIHNKPNTQCFKELCKHKYNCNNELIKLTRPPQSWCYIGGCDGKD